MNHIDKFSKPLWKFLADGGMSACVEYGQIDNIRKRANCCTWGTGDLLYSDRNTVITGQNNGFNCEYEQTWGSSSFSYMKKHFTRNMLNNGIRFLGLGDKIPHTIPNHFIIAAFHRDNREFAEPDFHFIRQHDGNAWSHRPGRQTKIEEIDLKKAPETIQNLIPGVYYGHYSVFKGWYAVPNVGVQNGLDATIFQIKERVGLTRYPESIYEYLQEMQDFYILKNRVLNNVKSLEQLENDFDNLIDNMPFAHHTHDLTSFMAEYNQNKFPKIINSPARSLWKHFPQRIY